jgi:hypothetical protein
MDPLSRRKFLAHGAAAAGAVAIVGQLTEGAASAGGAAGATGSAAGASGATGAVEGGWWPESSSASEPFVVYIRDAAKGEVAVFKGEEEIVYNDRALVGRLQRAMRRAAW